MTQDIRGAAEAVIKVWQEAPANVSFGSHMERALSGLYAALILCKESGIDESNVKESGEAVFGKPKTG